MAFRGGDKISMGVQGGAGEVVLSDVAWKILIVVVSAS